MTTADYMHGLVKEVYCVLTPKIINTRQARSVEGACGRLKTVTSNKIYILCLVNSEYIKIPLYSTVMINGKQCNGEAMGVEKAKLLAFFRVLWLLVGEIADLVVDVPPCLPSVCESFEKQPWKFFSSWSRKSNLLPSLCTARSKRKGLVLYPLLHSGSPWLILKGWLNIYNDGHHLNCRSF